MRNNMLIKTRDINIIRKILNFFKNVFHKDKKDEIYNIQLKEAKQKNNIIKELEEKRKIIELQEKYEANIVREEDLTKEEKEKLVELYEEQIATINNNIQTGLKELEFYKQKNVKG